MCWSNVRRNNGSSYGEYMQRQRRRYDMQDTQLVRIADVHSDYVRHS